MGRDNGNTPAGKAAAEKAKAESERIAAEQAEAERLAAEQAEAARVAAEQAEAARIAAEQAEAARLAADQAEADRIAAEQAESAGHTYDDDEGGAGGDGQGTNDKSLPAAGVFRGPVRELGRSATRAVVTDGVDQWKVDLAAGDPLKSVAPSLRLRAEQEADGSATPAPVARKPQVVGKSATHRTLDDGVRRWKEPVA